MQSLHNLRKADFILEQNWKMGAVLSPLLSNIRDQFKTPQFSDIKSMNENLQHDTTFVLSKDRGNKLEQLKRLCPGDNNGTFVTEQHTLLQRAITQTENKILKLFFYID